MAGNFETCCEWLLHNVHITIPLFMSTVHKYQYNGAGIFYCMEETSVCQWFFYGELSEDHRQLGRPYKQFNIQHQMQWYPSKGPCELSEGQEQMASLHQNCLQGLRGKPLPTPTRCQGQATPGSIIVSATHNGLPMLKCSRLYVHLELAYTAIWNCTSDEMVTSTSSLSWSSQQTTNMSTFFLQYLNKLGGLKKKKEVLTDECTITIQKIFGTRNFSCSQFKTFSFWKVSWEGVAPSRPVNP